MKLAMRGRLPFRSFLPVILTVCLLPLGVAADTILVVPFENINKTAELDWVGESFSEALSGRLLGHGHGLVTRDERLGALERLGLPPTSLSRASLLRLGEEVGADWVVLGRFTVEEDSLRAGMQLLYLRAPRLTPWVEARGPFAALLESQGALAWAVLKRVDPEFPLTREEFQRRRPQLRVSAFESYIRGLLAMNPEQQRHYFVQALRLQADYTPAAFRLAMLDFEAQDYGAAADWLGKIPAEDSLAPQARFYLSLCYHFQGDAARAVTTLEPLTQHFPVSSVWNNLGVFASRRGRAADAVRYFSRALADVPGDADACFNLGLHHLRSSDWKAAAATLEQCTELNPGDSGALLLLASALDRLGRGAEAAEARERAGEEELAGDIDLSSIELDRLDQHLAVPLPGAGALDGSFARERHVQVHVERGRDLLARGAVEEAREQFIEAVLLNPASYRAHLHLAELYNQEGHLEEAISELKASLWSKDTAEARLRLAEIYLLQDQPEEARRHVRAALALDPENSAARAFDARLPLRTADTPAEEGSME